MHVSSSSFLAGRKVLAAVFAFAVFTSASPAMADPYLQRIFFKIDAGDTSDCVLFPVPADNLVTLEFLSILIEATATGQQLSGVILYSSLGSSPLTTESFTILPMNALGPSTFQGAQTIKAFADDESFLRLCVSRAPTNTTGDLYVYGSLAGTVAAM